MTGFAKRVARLEGNRTSTKGWVLANAPANWPEERCLRRAFELLQDDLDQADATVDVRRQEGLSDVSIVYATEDLSRALRSVADQRRRI
ncbi:hypothetical protein ACSQ76_00005, partial [Roseovarius sp. B08]|uniref:hypothetical protein n=1 Tax=Roseovarius sp. B08 TaxID=3449223 RepID=UPI003EDC8F88